MTEELVKSNWWRQKNAARGELIILELNLEDAALIFCDCPRAQNPIDFLKWQTGERRRLDALVRKSGWSVVLFIVALFFLRRFIP